METCNNNAIILDVISRVIVPLISTILGAVIGGVATHREVRWQYEKKVEEESRKMKRELANDIAKTSTDLQIATSSNFMISDVKDAEKPISEVISAYAVFLKTTENVLIYLPHDVRKPIEEYRDLTHHNITVWHDKIWGDLVYKDDPLVPFIDQTTKDGKAKKAYDKVMEKISEYVKNQE